MSDKIEYTQGEDASPENKDVDQIQQETKFVEPGLLKGGTAVAQIGTEGIKETLDQIQQETGFIEPEIGEIRTNGALGAAFISALNTQSLPQQEAGVTEATLAEQVLEGAQIGGAASIISEIKETAAGITGAPENEEQKLEAATPEIKPDIPGGPGGA